MKSNKKGLLILVAAFLVATTVIFEYLVPASASAESYYVQVTTDGAKVTRDRFQGYEYKTKAYTPNGKERRIVFYSEKKLSKNAQYKVVVGQNKIVNNYKKVNDLPEKVKYLAEK
ncbi:YxeA family protein [Listeria costaricensis]|uniref:YxeA family protein n=1 Tax=Listeria costaricensis TaxID=2026604 RepID=UPI000C089301|nr:YxeA family protein [Listeria costaricensis]